VAGFFALLASLAWRALPSLGRWIPRQHAAAVAAMLGAIGYAAVAGFALPQAKAASDEDPAAIRQAILDYAEGYYGHAPERMERAVSPLLNKRGLNLRPGVAILQQNAEMLIDACRGNAPRPGPADRKMTVEVLDVQSEVASGRVFSVQFNDYIHLAKRSGRWQLVNVLWHQPPAAAGGPDASAAALSVAGEFAAALAGTDGQAVSRVLYPSAVVRQLAPGQDGSRIVRDMNPETLVAMLSSGQPFLQAKPADIKTTVLGVDGDLASAKIATSAYTWYLHLGQIAGRWQVVNALGYRTPAP